MKSRPVVSVRNCLLVLLLLIVSLLALNPGERYASAASEKCDVCSQAALADDQPLAYPIMRMTAEQKRAEAELARSMPAAPIDPAIQKELQGRSEGAALNLLSHIQYTPSQRNQGSAGNCWAWASTGVLEVALDVQRSIKDRLSIQYLDSSYSDIYDTPPHPVPHWAGCGGTAWKFGQFYSSKLKVIPWSNTSASYQDGGRSCASGSSLVAPGSIGQTPSYPITSIGPAQQISTHTGVTATNIANIQNILNQNKAVYFAYYLANNADWDQFGSFWNTQAESVIWPNGFSCGDVWNNAEGGGHAVLCVGYDDSAAGTANDYWIMLNSWGAEAGRPAGLFRIPMYYDYNCADSESSYNTEWWTIPVTFTGGGSVPAKPTILYPRIPGTSVTLYWNAPATATKYWLEVSENSSFTGTLKFNNTTLTTNSRTVTGFANANNKIWYWRVRAGNATGWSTAWSTVQRFKN